MRNAAAALDDDFGYDAPAPRKAARKPRAAASGKKKKGKRFGWSWDRVARYGAIGISATVGVGIMVNALMMQKGRHPAPLFGKSLALHSDSAAAAAAPPVTAQATEAAAAPAAAAQPEATTPNDGATAGKARRSALAQHGADAPGDDPIARLLNGGKAAGATAEKGDGKTVLGVQKALIKLGYTVKANGTMGAATRKAIEAFEKDRHLPVNGEASRRLVKVLTAESGIRIE